MELRPSAALPIHPPSAPLPRVAVRRHRLLPYLLVLLVLTTLIALLIVPVRKMLRTPRQTGVAFTLAIEENDQGAMKALAIGTKSQFKFVGGMSAWMGAYEKYETTFSKAFSDQKPFLQSSGKMMAQVETANEAIDGSTATLTLNTGSQILRFTRSFGQWKLQLSSLCSDTDAAKEIEKLHGLANAYDASRRELETGKIKTPQEARLQLKDRIDSVLFKGYTNEKRPRTNASPTTLPTI